MIIFKQAVDTFTSSNILDQILINGVLTEVLAWANYTEYPLEHIVRDGSWYYKTAVAISATENRVKPSEDQDTWARYSPSNPYAMLDDRSNTETTVSASPTVTYTTTGATQTVTTAIDDIVYFEVASGSTGTGVIGSYYKALTVQASIDLDTELFATDTTNWEDLGILGNIIVEFVNADRYDSIALGGIRASDVTVEMLDGFDTVLYTVTKTINEIGDGAEANWYSYYYNPLADQTSRYDVFLKLPQLGEKVRVTITESVYSGSAVSYMVVGNAIDCGKPKDDITFRLEDNSIKEKDSFGITSLTQRYAQDLSSIDTIIDTTYFLTLKRKMKKMLAIPIAVAIDDSETSNYENLLQLAYLDDFRETLRSSNKKSICSFEFAELV